VAQTDGMTTYCTANIGGPTVLPKSQMTIIIFAIDSRNYKKATANAKVSERQQCVQEGP